MADLCSPQNSPRTRPPSFWTPFIPSTQRIVETVVRAGSFYAVSRYIVKSPNPFVMAIATTANDVFNRALAYVLRTYYISDWDRIGLVTSAPNLLSLPLSEYLAQRWHLQAIPWKDQIATRALGESISCILLTTYDHLAALFPKQRPRTSQYTAL